MAEATASSAALLTASFSSSSILRCSSLMTSSWTTFLILPSLSPMVAVVFLAADSGRAEMVAAIWGAIQYSLEKYPEKYHKLEMIFVILFKI